MGDPALPSSSPSEKESRGFKSSGGSPPKEHSRRLSPSSPPPLHPASSHDITSPAIASSALSHESLRLKASSGGGGGGEREGLSVLSSLLSRASSGASQQNGQKSHPTPAPHTTLAATTGTTSSTSTSRSLEGENGKGGQGTKEGLSLGMLEALKELLGESKRQKGSEEAKTGNRENEVGKEKHANGSSCDARPPPGRILRSASNKKQNRGTGGVGEPLSSSSPAVDTTTPETIPVSMSSLKDLLSTAQGKRSKSSHPITDVSSSPSLTTTTTLSRTPTRETLTSSIGSVAPPPSAVKTASTSTQPRAAETGVSSSLAPPKKPGADKSKKGIAASSPPDGPAGTNANPSRKKEPLSGKFPATVASTQRRGSANTARTRSPSGNIVTKPSVEGASSVVSSSKLDVDKNVEMPTSGKRKNKQDERRPTAIASHTKSSKRKMEEEKREGGASPCSSSHSVQGSPIRTSQASTRQKKNTTTTSTRPVTTTKEKKKLSRDRDTQKNEEDVSLPTNGPKGTHPTLEGDRPPQEAGGDEEKGDNTKKKEQQGAGAEGATTEEEAKAALLVSGDGGGPSHPVVKEAVEKEERYPVPRPSFVRTPSSFPVPFFVHHYEGASFKAPATQPSSPLLPTREEASRPTPLHDGATTTAGGVEGEKRQKDLPDLGQSEKRNPATTPTITGGGMVTNHDALLSTGIPPKETREYTESGVPTVGQEKSTSSGVRSQSSSVGSHRTHGKEEKKPSREDGGKEPLLVAYTTGASAALPVVPHEEEGGGGPSWKTHPATKLQGGGIRGWNDILKRLEVIPESHRLHDGGGTTKHSSSSPLQSGASHPTQMFPPTPTTEEGSGGGGSSSSSSLIPSSFSSPTTDSSELRRLGSAAGAHSSGEGKNHIFFELFKHSTSSNAVEPSGTPSPVMMLLQSAVRQSSHHSSPSKKEHPSSHAASRTSPSYRHSPYGVPCSFHEDEEDKDAGVFPTTQKQRNVFPSSPPPPATAVETSSVPTSSAPAQKSLLELFSSFASGKENSRTRDPIRVPTPSSTATMERTGSSVSGFHSSHHEGLSGGSARQKSSSVRTNKDHLGHETHGPAARHNDTRHTSRSSGWHASSTSPPSLPRSSLSTFPVTPPIYVCEDLPKATAAQEKPSAASAPPLSQEIHTLPHTTTVKPQGSSSPLLAVSSATATSPSSPFSLQAALGLDQLSADELNSLSSAAVNNYLLTAFEKTPEEEACGCRIPIDNLHSSELIIRTLPHVYPSSKDAVSGGRVIIVGDVHGCAEQLEALLEKVRFDVQTDRLVMVGDLVNKGPDSVGVVRVCQKYKAVGVLGNHDMTLLSLCEENRRRRFHSAALRDPVKRLAVSFPSECEMFLRQLPHILRIPQYNVVVVHAGIDPRRPLEAQTVHNVLHIRRIATTIPDSSLDTAGAGQETTENPCTGEKQSRERSRSSSGSLSRAASPVGDAMLSPVTATTSSTAMTTGANGGSPADAKEKDAGGKGEKHRHRGEAPEPVVDADGVVIKGEEGVLWGKLYKGPETIIFGHAAQSSYQQHPFAIGLDTGCVYGNALTCIMFSAMSKSGVFAAVQGIRTGAYVSRVSSAKEFNGCDELLLLPAAAVERSIARPTPRISSCFTTPYSMSSCSAGVGGSSGKVGPASVFPSSSLSGRLPLPLASRSHSAGELVRHSDTALAYHSPTRGGGPPTGMAMGVGVQGMTGNGISRVGTGVGSVEGGSGFVSFTYNPEAAEGQRCTPISLAAAQTLGSIPFPTVRTQRYSPLRETSQSVGSPAFSGNQNGWPSPGSSTSWNAVRELAPRTLGMMTPSSISKMLQQQMEGSSEGATEGYGDITEGSFPRRRLDAATSSRPLSASPQSAPEENGLGSQRTKAEGVTSPALFTLTDTTVNKQVQLPTLSQSSPTSAVFSPISSPHNLIQKMALNTFLTLAIHHHYSSLARLLEMPSYNDAVEELLAEAEMEMKEQKKKEEKWKSGGKDESRATKAVTGMPCTQQFWQPLVANLLLARPSPTSLSRSSSSTDTSRASHAKPDSSVDSFLSMKDAEELLLFALQACNSLSVLQEQFQASISILAGAKPLEEQETKRKEKPHEGADSENTLYLPLVVVDYAKMLLNKE